MIYNRYSYERLLVLLFMIIVVALTVFIETLFVGKVDVVLKHPSGIYNSLFILKRQYILILWLFFFVSNAFVNIFLVLILCSKFVKLKITLVPKYLKIKYFKNLQTISIIVVVDDIDGVFKNPPDTCNSLSILNNKTSIHIDLTAMGFFLSTMLYC